MSAATDATPARRALSRDATQFIWRVAAALAVCVVLSLMSDAFLTTNNLLNVLRQTALLFLMASGLTLVILTAGLDLSVGANIGLSACLSALVIKATGSPWLAVATGVGCGAAIGLINGALVTVLRVPAFIATYGMMWLILGATYFYMGGETVHGFPPSFRQFGSGYFLGIPIPIYMMLLFLLVGTLFAQRTVWGQQIYAIGANPVAARLSGIPVERRLVLVYVVSGAMAGLASLILLARVNSAEADIGEHFTLPAIAAVVIGGTSLFGGSGTIVGTLVGALILTLVVNGMNLLQINASWQPLVTGVIILFAVWFDIRARKSGN